MGWAGSQIRATRRHVPMPRRWAWLHFDSADVEQRDVDGAARPVPRRGLVAHSRIWDGRVQHGEPIQATPAELWEIIDHWSPPRGCLWIWTDQPDLAPWGVGLESDMAGRWGWKRGHTRISDGACHVVWTRSKRKVVLASVQGAIRGWEQAGRPWLSALRDDVLTWAATVEHQGFGHFRATIGAQAWEAYRARWCDGSLYAGGSDPHKTIAREAIAGGIAHAFRTGDQPGVWTEVDMSRCYRTVMRDEELPVRAVSRLRRPGLPVLERALSRDCVIAAVALSERGMIAAERDDYGRLHWMGGPGLAVLTTPDLADAFKARVIDHVIELCTWTRGRPLAALGRGLEDLEVTMPPRDGSLMAAQIKPMANAVYGRLAMRSRRWRKWDTVDDDGLRAWSVWSMEHRRWERYRQIGPVIEREDPPCEHRWGHAALAAHVAAHGRARLRRLMDVAGLAHVAYVDTDGLIVDADGLEYLMECGLWDSWNLRIEAQGDLCIRGVRDYDLGSKHVQSGQPNGGR